ncbi:extracellular catalytic domain type 1 short-chain-length polyhydroxyalkanoate depolymerase [Ideonella sp. BN130291]|uniref:extracellular catalytic domain type 1 short-chain-length polyhydroxyalkanoate depolymerase n=1 Tax=Ideonella sp. BN130291 TaxID=3112940 RepID=UPI002E272B45|nr:PHB depolymerase family esterase [Ideonella sp. BN130291]
MNASFQRLMAEATRLTQSGDLQAATAAIQAALGQHGEPANDPGEVFDVQAREIQPLPALPPLAGAHSPGVAPAGDTVAEPVAPIPSTQPSEPSPPALQPEGRFITGRHTDAAATRDYKLFIPPGYRGQPLPLVVMLHGCTQHPDDFAAGTGMNRLAMAQECFVLYPAQSQKANPQRCWSWFKHSHQRRGRGEPALLAGMTRAVMAQYAIDPRRVYVAGLSAGGAMAAILGQTYPELFAAVGVHSGLPAGAAQDLPSALAAMKSGAASTAAGRAPPTIVFHGDQDHTVHSINGEQAVAASAGAAAFERERARSRNGRHYTRRVYRGADGQVVAEHWLVHGAGHAWSGGHAGGSYTDAGGPDASAEMLRFFQQHPLPPAA